MNDSLGGAQGLAISCGTRFTRAHILSAGRTRRESAPIPMTSFPVRNGKSMQVRYEKVGRTGKNRFTAEERESIDKVYYICQTYNRLGKNSCTSHKVDARDLYNLVLKDIQELAAMALKDVES